ncbi:MAG TPA: hypothetical protein VGV61_12660 [Thermoanaerobaculia bacterium]|jgi:hypothetical protein|nr:hypothetical protein [Thermoanaerobaculia bacterium]
MRKPDLSKLNFSGAPGVPTMIVPPGTQIQVDAQGQVSIRTPGNLVLQNSGAYAVLESVSGSIRIEPAVHVEAVTVRCADTCMVQGRLTAWRVVARTLHVDNDAEAHVVMQETDKLEVGRSGRLVGNFRSEKELYELFSRFAGSVRALPPLAGEGVAPPAPAAVVAEVAPELAVATGNGAAGAPSPTESLLAETVDAEEGGTEPVRPASTGGRAAPPADLPDPLCFALMLLERERDGGGLRPARRRLLGELVQLLRAGDVETLRHTYKTLFARLADSGEGVRRARRAVGAFFDAELEREPA